jgi:hypothetical protein
VILTALATAFLIPALTIMWSRRQRNNPHAAESMIFGSLLLTAAIACFYFALSLPIAVDDELLDVLVALLKIVLFAVGCFGVLAGASIARESYRGFSEGTKRG